VRAVALSADGKTVISGSDDGTLIVWGLEIGKERRMLNGHASPVRAVLLSPDERMIVSSSEDRTLKAWDIETGSCLASFTGDAAFTAVALGPSLRVFAGDLAGHVHLLELRLGPAVQRGPQS